MATTKIIPGVLDLNEATSDSGLKMPSGTDVREGADTTGKIRNNTSIALRLLNHVWNITMVQSGRQ